jgi:mono/diheme cytochrome c family protein
MMKYAFILVLGIVAACAGLMGAVVVYRFIDNMTHTARVVPGERNFPMPAGVVARGKEAVIPKEQREIATKMPNPVRMSAPSVAVGRERYVTMCAPCHGPEGKGGVTGPVATKFIPPPDLTNADLQKARTDGYWHSYIMVGGAVMPAYGETMSSQEAWHVVNYLRSLASK